MHRHINIPLLNEEQVLQKMSARYNPFHEEYYAFYSSWFGGIVKNPQLMFLPIDDHMVHRGDGVFEAMKAISRAVYLLEEHLERLFESAARIALTVPLSADELKSLVLETLRMAEQQDASIRIFLSRGPGNFSVNPYDAVAPQIYIIVTKLTPPPLEKYTQGVVIGQSNIPVKSPEMAQIKSCNYLPNVLMKKEAVDRSLDFVIGVDAKNHITESATENIMIVDQSGTIVHPPLDDILKGTTMLRACQLARAQGMSTAMRDISVADLKGAREVMITGTSLNILPVVQFEHQNIAQGIPGPIAKKLNALMLQDIQEGTRSTPF